MSEYEFWNELGNIFNAVVAYQQKTIEFNKRFVNPWIRFGTVFDKNDRNAEAVSAYQKAIEIDPQNAANWQALGDAYFKMGSFNDAAEAYSKAIELNPRSGWAYANLALTYATQQKYNEAVNLYIKSLEFLTEDKDRAMTWNRLGNAYRKVNDYENAFIAFQRADECDAGNTGFQDQLDEVPEQFMVAVGGDLPVMTEEIAIPDALAAQMSTGQTPVNVEPEQPTLSESVGGEPLAEVPMVEPVADAAVEMVTKTAGALEEVPVVETPAEVVEATNVPEPMVDQAIEKPVATEQSVEEPVVVVNVVVTVDETPVTAEQPVEVHVAVETTVESAPEAAAEPLISEKSQPETMADVPVVEEVSTPAAVVDVPADVSLETTVTTVLRHTVETIADAATVNPPAVVVVDSSGEVEVAPVVDAPTDGEVTVSVEPGVVTKETTEPALEVVEKPVAEATVMGHVAETEAQVEIQVEAVVVTESIAKVESLPSAEVAAEASPEVVVEVEVGTVVATPDVVAATEVQVEVEPVAVNEADAQNNESIIQEIISLTVDGKAGEAAYEEFLKDSAQPVLAETEAPADETAQQTPVEPAHGNNEVRLELDTKNAHVWNELGNVYFNSGAYEEAIAAYGKAIELDGWFAWPYSNLALAYVQKEKYAEAVLLYQRSIELFSSDKDKAVTWNRLGNVYRRMNDYDNAIASYQRADELDPNNATRSLRSRFSLLGSLNTEQSLSFAG